MAKKISIVVVRSAAATAWK